MICFKKDINQLLASSQRARNRQRQVLLYMLENVRKQKCMNPSAPLVSHECSVMLRGVTISIYTLYSLRLESCSYLPDSLYDIDVYREHLPFVWESFINIYSRIWSFEDAQKRVLKLWKDSVLETIITLALQFEHVVLIDEQMSNDSERLETIKVLHSGMPLGRCSAFSITKYEIAVLIAAGLLGVLARCRPCHPLPSFCLADYVFGPQSVYDVKVGCISLYFKELQAFLPENLTDILTRSQPIVAETPLSQEIVTLTRYVNPQSLLMKSKSTSSSNKPFKTNPGTSTTEADHRVLPEDYLQTNWLNNNMTLAEVEVYNDKVIQDFDHCIQADFANKLIGGGTLKGGMVQEEILFASFPELLVTILVTPELKHNEVLLIQGVERFLYHTGYSTSFRCFPLSLEISSGINKDIHGGRFRQVPFDATGRRRDTTLVAMDALNVSKDRQMQYSVELIARELLKATTALSVNTCHPHPENPRKPFVSGGWGCGAFGGDPQLKFIIQWLAASVAQRKLIYCTFNDTRVIKLQDFIKTIQLDCHTVSSLTKCLITSLNFQDSLWRSIMRSRNESIYCNTSAG